MANENKIINYSRDYFKGVPADKRKLIYQAAATMAAGYLSFDSTQVAGTGGGVGMLAGRVASLQIAYPWILTISAKMLEYLGLYDKKQAIESAKQLIKINNESSVEEPDDSALVEDSDTTDFKSTEDTVSSASGSSALGQVQQMQIVNKSGTVVDFTALLSES